MDHRLIAHSMSGLRWGRVLILLGMILIISVAAYDLRQTGGSGWMPGCFFRKLTGLECPGCGMTRGTHALLNGRWMEAFRFNPIGMILLPIAMLGLGVECFGWVRGKSVFRGLYLGRWGSLILLGVTVIWWIWRNVF
jgi:hypothetical protein